MSAENNIASHEIVYDREKKTFTGWLREQEEAVKEAAKPEAKPESGEKKE